MPKLIEACFTHSRTIISILVLIFISGTSAYIDIPKESAPDVKIPIIFIKLRLEGVSPEDSERLLVRPMEVKLRSIEGVKEMKSTAFQDGASIVLEFSAGFNSDKALSDVREKVDQAKADIPEDADEPIINEVNVSLFPVMVIHLSGEVPRRTLYRMAKDLQDAIEGQVSTVLEAKIVGDREDAVEVIIDPKRLEGYNLSPIDTLALIRRNNLLVTAGSIDTGQGRFSLKVPGVIETAQDLLSLPLVATKNSVVKVSDIAEVRRTYKDPTGYARHFGEPAVSIEVSKRTGENILETVAAVREVAMEIAKDWPKAVTIEFTQDQSTRIKDMIGDLQNNLVAAIILVMIVIVISMGWRSAILVGVAVPGAFLSGILIIAIMGFTLNIVVLFSLILSVGMLVDGAIIVAEYADRKMIAGQTPFQAYLTASQRMAWPVFTSIGTTLVVFLPLLFWPGIVGQFMKFLPITLLATLSSSILMALIFVPTLGSVFGKVSKSLSKESQYSIEATESGDLKDTEGLTRKYILLLDKALSHPGKVILGCLVIVFLAQFIYNKFGKGVEFFPDIDPDTVIIKVRARGNLSVDEKDALVRKVENKILGIKSLKSIYTNTDIGSGNGQTAFKGQSLQEDVIGLITLEFVDWDKREKVDVILEEIEKRISPIPGILVEFFKNKPGPPSDKPIQLQIASAQPELLEGARRQVISFLESLDDVINIEDNKPIPGIEWVLTVDRAQALKFGADISLIGSTIKFVSNGIIVDTYRPNDVRDEVDIIVRFPETYRTLDQLNRIKVRTSQGLVPISSFVKSTIQPKFATLNRSDGKRAYIIKADVKAGILADEKLQQLQKWLSTRPLNPKVIATFKGEEEDKQETSEFLSKAFGIALFSIAIILVTQFNSFFSMFLVLSSVIFSTVGMFFGLLITGQAFSIVMCGIGVIALSGIIVSNNILLIDTFDQIKGQYSNIREVILRTGGQRLRPVILTQLTTALGLLPIMLGLNIDFLGRNIDHGAPTTQWWIQLSTCIVVGVIFASPLTLIVTPCALMLRENFRRWRAS